MDQTNRRLGASSRNSSEVRKEIEPLGIEYGVNSDMPFSTPFRPTTTQLVNVRQKDLQDLEELLRDEQGLGPSVAQLKAMRMSDGQARALYRILTLPIRSALRGCTFVPAVDGEAESQFITNVFLEPPYAGGMSVTFQRFMSQVLQALFDGFSAFEKVYHIPETGPLKGKYTLKKLAHRPSETVTFITNENGNYRGIRQRTYKYGKVVDVYLPAHKAFYFAAQEDENPYYGVSFFQSAYYHWDKKQKLYFTAHLAAQRSAVGTRVGTVPISARGSAKTEFARNLANMAFNQYILMPEGFKVESLKEGGNFDFLAYLNHHNSQMSKSILAQFLDKDQGAGRGESSVVDNDSGSEDVFLMMLQSIMDDIAAQINHYIIPDLVDANFKGQKYPKFTWGKMTDDQKKRVAKTFDKLATAGEAALVTPEFMRELEITMADELGLEIDYEEIEEREEAERAAMAAQLELENAAANQEVTLDSVEALSLPGDDEVELSGETGDMLKLAHSFLDQAAKEDFNG